MPDRKPLTSIPSVEKTEDPGVVTFHLRGREFVVREIPAGEYEQAIRDAASEDDDGKTDMLLLEKLLVVSSTTIGGKLLDPEEWAKEKYPVYQRVVNETKKLHWLDLETDEEIDERKKAAAASARESAKKTKSDIPNS